MSNAMLQGNPREGGLDDDFEYSNVVAELAAAEQYVRLAKARALQLEVDLKLEQEEQQRLERAWDTLVSASQVAVAMPSTTNGVTASSLVSSSIPESPPTGNAAGVPQPSHDELLKAQLRTQLSFEQMQVFAVLVSHAEHELGMLRGQLQRQQQGAASRE